jgi:hypothetical protein
MWVPGVKVLRLPMRWISVVRSVTAAVEKLVMLPPSSWLRPSVAFVVMMMVRHVEPSSTPGSCRFT